MSARRNPRRPLCTQYRHNVRHGVGEDGMETVQRRETGGLFLSEC